MFLIQVFICNLRTYVKFWNESPLHLIPHTLRCYVTTPAACESSYTCAYCNIYMHNIRSSSNYHTHTLENRMIFFVLCVRFIMLLQLEKLLTCNVLTHIIGQCFVRVRGIVFYIIKT